MEEWPIRRGEKNSVRLGPRKLHFQTLYHNAYMSVAPDQRLGVVNVDWRTAHLLDLSTQRKLHTLKAEDVRYHAISPDGRWVVAGNWRGNGVTIWNAHTGKEVRKLPPPGSARVVFSADGRYLLVSGNLEYAIWRTADWERVHHESLPPFAYRSGAFSRDGRLAAITMTDGARLMSVPDGKQLATFLAPESFRARCVCTEPGRASTRCGDPRRSSLCLAHR